MLDGPGRGVTGLGARVSCDDWTGGSWPKLEAPAGRP